MLTMCNYKKAGQVADTFVIETYIERIVYFSKLTRETFDCSDKIMKDSFVGLHKLPLACDIITDDVRWPTKQSSKVESLSVNEIFSLGTTELPIASVNKSSKVHKSLRELIDKINTIVIINSIILAFLVTK